MIRRLGALTATGLASLLILLAAASGPASARTTGQDAADAGRDDPGALVDELIAHQLTDDPHLGANPQHWAPREPGLFTTVDGRHRIAFDRHGLMVGTGPRPPRTNGSPGTRSPPCT